MHASEEQEDPPPFPGGWNRLYILIVVYTCVLIIVLHLMTVSLNR